jgi:hypothetical protein
MMARALPNSPEDHAEQSRDDDRKTQHCSTQTVQEIDELFPLGPLRCRHFLNTSAYVSQTFVQHSLPPDFRPPHASQGVDVIQLEWINLIQSSGPSLRSTFCGMANILMHSDKLTSQTVYATGLLPVCGTPTAHCPEVRHTRALENKAFEGKPCCIYVAWSCRGCGLSDYLIDSNG